MNNMKYLDLQYVARSERNLTPRPKDSGASHMHMMRLRAGLRCRSRLGGAPSTLGRDSWGEQRHVPWAPEPVPEIQREGEASFRSQSSLVD